MATTYLNPPVVYTVAKAIYAKSIGSYGDEKYKTLLSGLEALGFDSYSVSKVMGVQLKQSDNQFTALPANRERVGYFSANKRRCAIIDENAIELRLSEYDNHTHFLDDFESLMQLFLDHGITTENKLREIELHYVDLFVPQNTCTLKDMFSSSVTLPMEQFYSDDTDAVKLGATNFTRILESGKSKISINLEQLNITADTNRRRYIPEALFEPDNNLLMPLGVERLFSEDQNQYAIVHTSCGSLVDMEQVDTKDLRKKFENLYAESRKTFDHMIQPQICNDIWKLEKKL